MVEWDIFKYVFKETVQCYRFTRFSVAHFLTKNVYCVYFHSLTAISVICLPRWTVSHHSRGRQQEDWARGTAGPPTHPPLERRQSVPVVPAQAGRPPCGHAASVCEEGKAVQSSSLGPDRWKWLEAHPNHIMGHRPRKCKYTVYTCISKCTHTVNILNYYFY